MMRQESDIHEYAEVPLSAESWDEILKAADSGDTEYVVTLLHERGWYDAAIQAWERDRLPDGTGSVAEALSGLPVTEQDRELLLASWLHDRTTGYHAVRTGTLLREVLARAPALAEHIHREHISHDILLRAGLLHDEGKKQLPRDVLAHPAHDETCLEMLKKLIDEGSLDAAGVLRRHMGLDDGAPMPSWDDVSVWLETHHARPLVLLPVRALVNQETYEKLIERGCTVRNASFKDVLDEHERFTGVRLAKLGYPPALVDIASHHHSTTKSAYPEAAATIGITSRIAQELLLLTDVFEAVEAPRPYKPRSSTYHALREVINVAERHDVSAFVTHQVVEALREQADEDHAVSADDPDRPYVLAYLATQAHERLVDVRAAA